MQQLTQKLGSGDMIIQEVPYPQLGKGMVIVKNHYSIISAGTEGSTVVAARKSLIGKAKERPQQVKQVIDTLKKQGPIQTYRAVMKKLDAYSPLGYSCAGEVIEVGEGVTEFEVGDKVACAGAGYANHAEIVSVPINLCVKLDKNASLKDSAYNTVGAIAMQGVRQADMRLGESCVIIGLGLLGQLAALILKASGVTVIGIDVSEAAVKQALDNKVVDLGLTRNAAGVEEQIQNATNGYGADTVIIAAATNSLDPINFAGAIARKKGKVIVLGAVPTGFERDPYWYSKELELKMACSYGPGRYDLNYEEKGIDYPLPYVRWTEKRNMEAFQNLIATKRIDIDYLTTHDADETHESIWWLIHDELYNIERNTVYKTSGNVGLIAGIQLLLMNISTPEQLSLAGRIGAFFHNFINPVQAVRNIYSNLKDLTMYGLYFSGRISNPRVNVRRGNIIGEGVYNLRNTPERQNRMNVIKNFRESTAELQVERFLSQYPKCRKYFNRRYGGTSFLPKQKWNELMATDGYSEWTEGFINTIDGTNAAPREVIKNFLTEMEMMMFPDKIAEYTDYMKSIGLGSLLNIFPTSPQMRSAVLTAGGLTALYTMVKSIYTTISFIELNKHSLKKYDELLKIHSKNFQIKGLDVKNETQMLRDYDAVKDNENNFYSKTPSSFGDTPIFTQTDNPHLKFIPKYHRETGLTMMPIPENLQKAIIGFVVISEEQANNPSPIKGLICF